MTIPQKFADAYTDGIGEHDYLNKVFKLKSLYEMTWDNFADVVNDVLNTTHSESYYRKKYYRYVEDNVSEEISNNTDLLLEIKKERVKLSDERVQNNAYVRKLAREDTIKELGREAASIVAAQKPLIPVSNDIEIVQSEKQGILMLSDWHYGLEVDSVFNTYNTQIARQRITSLLMQTVKLVKDYKLNKLYVINLADLIAGRIHLTIRLESRIDVITQIMDVSEILSEFLSTLCDMTGVDIVYYDCCDNHSRIEPNKTDALRLETLSRITSWYLDTRLNNYNNIKIIKANDISDEIITTNILGHEIAAVHGDLDSPGRVVDNLTLMTHRQYDMILTAHFHHFSCDEKNECLVIGNGTLMGTDSYAEKLRLSSKPSQNFIVITKDNPCESLHRILV